MEDIKQKIVGLLRDELPASLLPNVDEIEDLITWGKYREAYLKMHEIRKDALWSPTSEYLQLMKNSGGSMPIKECYKQSFGKDKRYRLNIYLLG